MYFKRLAVCGVTVYLCNSGNFVVIFAGLAISVRRSLPYQLVLEGLFRQNMQLLQKPSSIGHFYLICITGTEKQTCLDIVGAFEEFVYGDIFWDLQVIQCNYWDYNGLGWKSRDHSTVKRDFSFLFEQSSFVVFVVCFRRKANDKRFIQVR